MANERIPRFGEGGSRVGLHHAMHCSGTDVSVMVPAETKSLTEEAISMLEEAKRLINMTVKEIRTEESAEDEGVNLVTFVMRDGSEKTFKVRNGSRGEDGEDGNIEAIEEAIARANKAATKAEAAEKLKEAYTKLVIGSLTSTKEGILLLDQNDATKYVSVLKNHGFGVEEAKNARENISAADEAEFREVKNWVYNLANHSDALVGAYELLDDDVKDKLVADGFVLGERYVYYALNYLFKVIGAGDALDTTAQVTNDAINELVDAIPEPETDDVDMFDDVFYS